ncbi:MAG: tetratricopeptide repeat protein [Pseudomonadota bacterium]
MAYDLEEQEQLASMKAFWAQYGNLITWVLIVALGAFAAYTFWGQRNTSQAREASALYDDQLVLLAAKDNAKVQRIAADVQAKYSRTVYASMSALVAARSAFDANDNKGAKAHLQWVVEHGNDEYKSVARLRLAAVLLDEKAYDEALKTIATDMLPSFAGAVADRKGDILAAQNKVAEARAAYKAALEAMAKDNPGRQLVQYKLDALGEPAPKAAA